MVDGLNIDLVGRLQRWMLPKQPMYVGRDGRIAGAALGSAFSIGGNGRAPLDFAHRGAHQQGQHG
jgi:hypothetical protein